MIAYDPSGGVPLPYMPEALVDMCVNRWELYHASYGQRWKWLADRNLLPDNPGAEVFEVDETTIYDTMEFPHTEEGRQDWRDSMVGVVVDDFHLDWLEVKTPVFDADPFRNWKDRTEYPPPSSDFDNALSSEFFGWAVWHMWLLLLTEEVLSLKCAHWRDNY